MHLHRNASRLTRLIPNREALERAIATLSVREADVMRWRCGLVTGEPLLQREVGEMLGLTQSYVAATERRAIERIAGARPAANTPLRKVEEERALTAAVMRLRGYDGGPVRDQREVARELGICSSRVGKLERAERERRGIPRAVRANVRTAGVELGPRLPADGMIDAATLADLDLSDMQRTVMTHRLGLATGEPMTLAAVGRRLGVTRQRVQQIETTVRRLARERAEVREWEQMIAESAAVIARSAA